MTDAMMSLNMGLSLVHSNFSLNTSLLFYRHRLFSKSYKIRTYSTLPDLYDQLSTAEKSFVESKLPIDIKVHDEGVKEALGIER